MAPTLLDTNVLVYAVDRRSRLHAPSALLVHRGLRERGLFCVAPQNLLEFVSVVTRPRYAEQPLTSVEAVRRASLLYRSRRLAKIYPARGTVLRALQEGQASGVTGRRWFDLFLAATMRDAGVREIVTENVDDFRPFPFVTVRRIGEV